MAVLFCRWAVSEEQEEEEEEDKKDVSVNSSLGQSDKGEIIDVNVKSGSEDGEPLIFSDRNDNRSTAVDVTGDESTTDTGGVMEMENCENTVIVKVDDLKVKDCLRAPGMVFKPWNDQEEEWESEEEVNSSTEEERPKFFSFNESKEDEFKVEEESGSRRDCQESIENEIKEKPPDDTVLNFKLLHDHETDSTESDFSVHDLVIQKIETTSFIKTEPEDLQDKTHSKFKKKKTFIRKSTTPKKTTAKKPTLKVETQGTANIVRKSIKKKAPLKRLQSAKVNKVAPTCKTKKRLSMKVSPVDDAIPKPCRSRRSIVSSSQKIIDVEEVETEVRVFGNVKLEADVDMCGLITDTIDVEENIAKLKIEQNESVDDVSYEYACLGDPLGDPLSTLICSSAAVKPFSWPKLDPLFHTVTEFKLPKEFVKLIKALQKPTAKIQPLVRPVVADLDIKTDTVEESGESSREKVEEGARRKRKASSNELKHLFAPSSVHPSAVILPKRRRSQKQEEVVEKPTEMVKECEEVVNKQKNNMSRRKKKKTITPSNVDTEVDDSLPPVKKSVKKSKGQSEKSKSEITVVKAVPPPYESGDYQVVCKTGRYRCPLCSTRWSLNQTYGRHVVSMTCQVDNGKGNLTSAPWILAGGDPDEDLAILSETLAQKSNIFVSVNPATSKKDSFVTTSHVPSLKLLCRGAMHRNRDPPPIRVKEGLEYYHALVWPDNNKEEVVFKFMSRLAKMTLVTSVREYEKLCREPLKVALYLEKKIGKSRERVGHRHSQTRRWVDKYTLFLTLPLHDIFLVVSQVGYRVLEFPLSEARVGLLCLVCPAMSCKGCLANQAPKQKPWQPGHKHQIKVKVKTTPPKVNKSSQKSLAKPSLVAPPSEPKLPPLQLHICSPCKTVFNSKPALASHREVCKGGIRE